MWSSSRELVGHTPGCISRLPFFYSQQPTAYSSAPQGRVNAEPNPTPPPFQPTDSSGRVVGINSAIYTNTGASVLGFEGTHAGHDTVAGAVTAVWTASCEASPDGEFPQDSRSVFRHLVVVVVVRARRDVITG